MSLLRCYLLYLICYIGAIFAAALADQPIEAQANADQLLNLDEISLLEEPLSDFTRRSDMNATVGALDPAISRITCYHDAPAAIKARLQRMVIGDYHEAVDFLLTSDNAMDVRKINVYYSAGTRFAQYETASIGLHFDPQGIVPPPPRTAYTTTPSHQRILFARIAALVVQRCVTEDTEYLGGFASLWGNSRFYLSIDNPRRVSSAGGLSTS